MGQNQYLPPLGEFKFLADEIPALRNPDLSYEYTITDVRVQHGPIRLADAVGFGMDGRDHPWEVTSIPQGNDNVLYVVSGRVLENNVMTFEDPVPPGGTFALIQPTTVVFLELTKEAGTGLLTDATVKAEAVVPVDTETLEYRLIAEVTVQSNPNGNLYVRNITQRLFEDIRFGEESEGDGILHPWKVTIGTPIDEAAQLDIRGGIVNTQETFVDTVVAGVTLPAVSGEVMLKITRGSAGRDLTATAIEMIPAANIITTVSDYVYQYLTLASITVVDGLVTIIEQRRFEDVQIFEDMAVVNGEFRLVSLEMAGRTHYAVPT